MATLSRDEIRNYAANAGFSGDNLDIAVAVALAESGGNTTAHNTKPPDNSYGLWQINMYGDLGPSRRAAYHMSDNDALFTPAINARVAYGIWKGSGWNAWTTYTTGKYKQYMEAGSFVDGLKDKLTDVSGLSTVASSVNAFGKTLFNGVASIVAVLVALALLSLGVVILLRRQIPTKKITKTLGKKVTS